MPYELLPRERLPEALRRLATEELDTALSELDSASDRPVASIHTARKRCKQVRTVLRLARGGGLTEMEYRQESLVVRNAARMIGPVRDAQVAVQTVRTLRGDLDSPPPELAARLRHLGERLERRQQTLVAVALGEERRVATAIRRLEIARSRVPDWPLRGEGFETIQPGLRRLYRQGRRRLGAAQRGPSTERFHDLRKRVKDLWYATRILRPLWPGPMDAAIVEWHRLSDLLGDEHDLAGVERLAREELAAEVSSVTEAIHGRRSAIRSEAIELARRLFLEPPTDFSRRLESLWRSWQSPPEPHIEEDPP